MSLSTTAANDRQHRTEMASGQLPEFINKDEIQVRLTRGYTTSGVRRGDLGQPSTGTDQGC